MMPGGTVLLLDCRGGGGGTVEISNGGTIDNDHYIFFVARIGVRLKVFGRLYANDGLGT